MITIALVLLSIPGVRQVGVTMMASAGLAALAIGAAALALGPLQDAGGAAIGLVAQHVVDGGGVQVSHLGLGQGAAQAVQPRFEGVVEFGEALVYLL